VGRGEDRENGAAESLADAGGVAAMAVFLASPRAANVTGQTINVDGGYVMHS